MAQRPWIQPDDVREYTENPTVQERSDARLAVDIARAENYVVRYCGHDFDSTAYPVVPDGVRIAVLLAAECYAARSAAEATGASLLRSETMDDYSYTARDTEAALDNLHLGDLLDAYVTKPINNGIRMDAHIW